MFLSCNLGLIWQYLAEALGASSLRLAAISAACFVERLAGSFCAAAGYRPR
jgi:hypothetical protein